jgi:calcium channel MID1
MKFSPMQSRLAASLLGSVLLLFIYFSLFSPHFALADESLKQTLPIILEGFDIPIALDGRSHFDPEYEPEFAAFDRSISGRAPAGVLGLANNVKQAMNVVPGTTELFVFEKSTIFTREDMTLELRAEDGAVSHGGLPGMDAEETAPEGQPREHAVKKRQSSKMVYISANTCTRPEPNPDKTSMEPPQLTMFVSTSPDNQSPGPSADAKTQVVIEFVEGAVMYNTTTTGDVFIAIHAPNVSSLFTQSVYNVEVAASSDTYFHSFNAQNDADLIWVDSDSQGALLITHNLTDSTDEATADQIMRTQPYVMFAQNTKEEWSIKGLKYSYCGLQNSAQIAATRNGKFASMVTTGMTRRGPGNLPKQQFYFSGLNASASYLGILALNGDEGKSGDGVAGGGGHVYRATNFTTKSGMSTFFRCRYLSLLPVYNGFLTKADPRSWQLPDRPKPALLRPGGLQRPRQPQHLRQRHPAGDLLRRPRPGRVRQLPKGHGPDLVRGARHPAVQPSAHLRRLRGGLQVVAVLRHRPALRGL